MELIKVHGVPFSSCTATVLACLNEKEVGYELIPVNLMAGHHKQPPFLSINPFGQVPALQDGDLTLFESRAIAKYLCKKYHGQGKCDYLLGGTVEEQALVEQWCEVESQQFNPPLYAIVQQLVIIPMITGGSTDEEVVDSNVEKLSKVLDVYEKRLSKSEHLAGDFYSLADLHHLPFLHCLVNLVGKGHLVSSRQHVNAWYHRISSRPAWRKVSCNMKFPFQPALKAEPNKTPVCDVSMSDMSLSLP
eukprot:PITA_29653